MHDVTSATDDRAKNMGAAMKQNSVTALLLLLLPGEGGTLLKTRLSDSTPQNGTDKMAPAIASVSGDSVEPGASNIIKVAGAMHPPTSTKVAANSAQNARTATATASMCVVLLLHWLVRRHFILYCFVSVISS